MANIYCVKCGIEGDSKCPFCRTIRTEKGRPGERKYEVAMLDTVFSYRLILDDPKLLKVKLWPEETWSDVLIQLRDMLKDCSDAEIKIFGCTHSWDFMPFSKSDIECGHGSEEKPLLDYMADAWYYLTDGADNDPSRHPHPDDDDADAAAIIHAALTAIDEGVEWDYKTWKGEVR